MKNNLHALLAAVLALACAAAIAQAPARIRAKVVSMKDNTLVVRTAADKEIHVQVNDRTRIQSMRKMTMADIKPGDFIGSAAMPGPDGKLVAREVRIFPESLRGTGEGHRPMDVPNQTMTNASVAKTVKGANRQELVVQYKGGSKTIIVPADAPVMAYVPGDRSLLVPGSEVNVSGQMAPDGTVAATSITATARDGTKPF